MTDGSTLVDGIRKHVPTGQFLRYMAVGCWNTLFGYSVYAALTYVLTGLIPYPYMLAAVLGNVISITMAYFGYKIFVFKTQGNYLREYLRCYVVYGASALVGLALLPVLVFVLGFVVSEKAYVPYIAGAILTAGTVFFSFIGHKHFSFRPRPSALPSQTGSAAPSDPKLPR